MKARILTKYFLSIILLTVILSTDILSQQNLSFIRQSPKAKVSQDIGFANIEISYSRPGVKGREVWGKLVPHGLGANAFGNGNPMPWRAGADENTTIKFSHDAKVEGKKIPAGVYSLHMIANKTEWEIIFNKDIEAWGSFFYDPSEDQLRVKVKPVDAEHEEWLRYGFSNLTLGSCSVFLHWEKLKIPFKVEFDQHEVALEKYRNELSGIAGFNNAAWGAAARYCLQNNVNLDEANVWIDKALSIFNGNNFANKSTKSGLLAKAGKAEESEKLMKEALEVANEQELNTYGYQLMGQGKIEEALKIFEENIDRHPDAWNTYDSYAEALRNKGDIEASKKYYKKAHEIAPENQKERISEIIKSL